MMPMAGRSINTTKSGKYRNPTDQARKEARKRELKKNKKQRIAVRHAVLKSKDALQLLEEASMYDKEEYDWNVQSSSLNERVLQGKRKRLLETFDNIVSLYKKEDPEYAKHLLRARKDYDKRRHDMMLYYEQVKLAERTKASDDIPLPPDLPPSQLGLNPADIPMPMGFSMPLNKGIFEKPLPSIPGHPPPGSVPVGRKPPGPPPLPVPDLSDSESENTDRIPTASRRTLPFADIDFRNTGNSSGFLPSQIPFPSLSNFPTVVDSDFPSTATAASAPVLHMSSQSVGNGVLSSTTPPRMLGSRLQSEAGVAGSSSSSSGTTTTATTTIEAKPQLKKLFGDVTRFVPTILLVRRTVRDSKGRLVQIGGGGGGGIKSSRPSTAARRQASIPGGELGVSGSSRSVPASQSNATSIDAAYEEFMQQIQGLL